MWEIRELAEKLRYVAGSSATINPEVLRKAADVLEELRHELGVAHERGAKGMVNLEITLGNAHRQVVRERDEALSKNESFSRVIEVLSQERNEARAQVEDLQRERDEARRMLRAAGQELKVAHAEVQRLTALARLGEVT